ncbi:conserved hypothetical protein [Leishmania braziliensis MHOM/BR/75/M2904]|uniref:Uncharacterized protein n=3 Tax=Viannia TaxID=37616 RepID=A4HCJ4_LEIBR|nr:conserved hypothetical protein [Leishmania braziliensis MHOM/BR/75/M2904]KAI5686199.1 hypothetical protein MNV84_03879 [Leishmania braziliensis]CAJ2472980.1 unnamed protein product [Leishmania braziliensis]CAM45217.1 conserved hypothetical protein [Leishmania braziliensis MHOM/BR/75/M2904]SYZ65967.1 hypothetical_protein [Leishmania braziliensis MHOM/BR/75/M2904]
MSATASSALRTATASPGTLDAAADLHTSEAVKETFKLLVRRLVLVDTAEDNFQWSSRAKQQWGGGKPLFVSVSNKFKEHGSTSPRNMMFGHPQQSQQQSWSGIEWRESNSIAVPLEDDPVLMIEVGVLRHGKKNVLGLGIMNTQSILTENRQYTKFTVHVLPTHISIDASTVHVVAEVEIYSSLLRESPDLNFTPLEYNYGTVRVSTVDFYYPSFFLTGTGEYIVSNVLCAMNMTEFSSLAMQLVPLRSSASYIATEPSQVITVRPQQRVYFSATWNLTHRACMRTLEMQLTVNGSQKPSAPVLIKVHNQVPQTSSNTDVPFHYWVNTTCITNRQMLPSQELPLIHAVLPVYRFISRSAPIDQREGMIVAFDKDKGEHVLVRANGVPVTMGKLYGSDQQHQRQQQQLQPQLSMQKSGTGAYALSRLENMNFMGGGDMVPQFDFDVNASFVVCDNHVRNPFSSRGPLLNLSQKTCLCTIALGPIRGFPMVYEATTGLSPSFQVSVTLLDQRGWQVVHGETLPSYHSASGSLRWAEQLVLRKWPGATSQQFVRLNLTEVRPRDGDETPIGAGLISLPSMQRLYTQNPLSVAFYVYETYSLYDQLSSSSLLMKDVNVIFSELR